MLKTNMVKWAQVVAEAIIILVKDQVITARSFSFVIQGLTSMMTSTKTLDRLETEITKNKNTLHKLFEYLQEITHKNNDERKY